MKYNKILLAMLMFYLFGCDSVSENNQESATINLLKKEWTNSIEEEKGLEKIFRPSDYKDFPTLRYRQSFIFDDNNKCKYYVLADNNGHYYVEGTWELENNNQLIVISDSTNHIIYQLKITELSKNLLKCIYMH